MAREINVDAMLRRITAKQFRAWEHYYELDPFQEDRAGVERAQIAAMIFNMAVAVNDRKAVKDFLIPWGDSNAGRDEYTDGSTMLTTRAPQSFEEQIVIAKIMTEASMAGIKDS